MEQDTTRSFQTCRCCCWCCCSVLHLLNECNVNCTRIIPFRKNLVQSHRFKSSSVEHTAHTHTQHMYPLDPVSTNIPYRTSYAYSHREKCTKCTCGRETMGFSIFYFRLKLESLPNEHRFRNCSMNFTSIWTFSFTSQPKFAFSHWCSISPVMLLNVHEYMCVCGLVSGRQRRWC